MLRSEAAMSGRRSSNCDGSQSESAAERIQRLHRNGKAEGSCRSARDGMFILRARHAEIGQRCDCAFCSVFSASTTEI
jgi:hypothetical protein